MDIFTALWLLGGSATLAVLGLLVFYRRQRQQFRRRLHEKDLQRAALFRQDTMDFRRQLRKLPAKHHAGRSKKNTQGSNSQPAG